ncbi:MAG: SMC-Scp complex subunit ScpB [Planctomycetaceae bacterium]|nr:SMC-Scp complex subunit ScpB [Planctomycetaceae bacterium]
MWDRSTSWLGRQSHWGIGGYESPLLSYAYEASPHGWRYQTKDEASAKQSGLGGVRSPKLARLEAVLFVADSPLSAKKMADAGKLVDASQCQDLIEDLNVLYDAEGSPFRVEQIASGYQLLTRPEFSQWLDRIHHRNVELKLSPPALETLTIIAYRQQITRADIEAIRGVQSSEVMKQLMERQLIRIGGEEDSLGRPYLYETTKFFLQYLGIRRIEQLPNYQQFQDEAAQKAAAKEQEAAQEDEELEEYNEEEIDEEYEDDEQEYDETDAA